MKEKILCKLVEALNSVALCTAYSLVRRKYVTCYLKVGKIPQLFYLTAGKKKCYLPLVTIHGETSSHPCSQHQNYNGDGSEFVFNCLIFKVIRIIRKYSGCTLWRTQRVYIRQSSR